MLRTDSWSFLPVPALSRVETGQKKGPGEDPPGP
jgi:hypothetical protein